MARGKGNAENENTVSPLDFKNSILDCLSNKKLYEFVKWYCTSDQSEKSYDTIKKYLNDVEFKFAIENHLNREDVQNAIKLWIKKTKDMSMLKVYNVMLNKALEGDVKSADWLSKFGNSDFFKDDEESELHDFAKGLNIDISGSDTSE